MALRFPPSGFTDRTAARAGVHYASWLRRFAGAIIDGLLLSMINFLIGGVLSFVPNPFVGAILPVIELVSLLSVISIVYATMCLDRLGGQTPGMRVMQIRCVPVRGHGQVTFAQALTRSIAAALLTSIPWVISVWVPAIWLLPIVAYLWPLVDSRRQTWWDHLAATIVLDDRGW